MSEQKKCESTHEFKATHGKHDLDGQKFVCELEAGHTLVQPGRADRPINHTAKTGRTYVDENKVEQPELVHWQ